jgi:uncharacterized protein (DUF2141 family)
VNTEPRKVFLLLAFLSIAWIIISCAHQGSLSGGPKDTEPPQSVEADPPDRTTRFQAKRIIITFNEFIQLKDPGKEIFMSPPMKAKPEFKAHGKDLIIEFKEDLKENTTYTINFGNSVADFTETNPYPNFEYVFSTGDVIDSLWVSGKVLNAFNHKPEPDIIAMVYTDDNDSLPLDSLPIKVRPKSASRTDKDGKFRINNLPPGQYKLIALQDYNNNFYYDLPNERIAFLDSLVTLAPPVADTIAEIEGDTMAATPAPKILSTDAAYTLYIFEQTISTQKLLGKKLVGTNRLQYSYRMPLDTFAVSLQDSNSITPDWFIPEYSKNRDTVDLWLKSGLPDTIYVVTYAGDSITDTSRFNLTAPARPARQKKDEVQHLKFKSNTLAGAFDINQELKLTFNSPLLSTDSTKILLKSSVDSLSPSLTYGDPVPRTVIIHHTWNQEESYRIIFDDSAFMDQKGLFNDSTMIGLNVRSVEDYGVLILSVTVPELPGQFIIQLLDQNENILREQFISKSGLLRFEFLLPANYKLKAIHDVNGNKRWNPGNYRAGLLPETVQYYPGDISIRANWDLQEDWKLKAK